MKFDRFLIILLPILILSLYVISCGKGASSASEVESNLNVFEVTTESLVTSLAGLADEVSGESFSRSSCTRASSETCSSGVKSATYSSCSISGTTYSLTGSVDLTYSQTTDCTMNLPADYVVRTYDYTISGTRGGSLQVTSASATDYRGTSISGGGKITKTLGGYTAQILGKHKILSFRGSEIMNHSMISLSASTITGTLARSSRSLTGGEIEIIDNRNEFVATVTPTSLQWSSSCCYPLSGSLSMELSGSKSGTVTVVFSSTCGTATYTANGSSRNINLKYCE